MFSWIFGTKKQGTSSGTGYGGDLTAGGQDAKNLRQGRKEAALEESKRDASRCLYLKQTESMLKSKSLNDPSKLVSTLKETFRNQVPSEWATRKKLYLASLACFRLVILNYSEILGDKNETDSLYTAFDEFAQHADFLRKHDGEVHAQLVEIVLQVQSMAAAALQNTRIVDVVELTDPRENYRKALGPLRFDVCDSLNRHRFSTQRKSSRLNTRKMFQEISSYKTSLPVEYGSGIYVRAMEGRFDLLRALIIGPEDTPYTNGCFFFDIFLKNYPSEPPLLQFLTTGGGKVTFNPNLYANGKVCLSLLGTWIGPGWLQGESTLLQVLVSIQSLIFVSEPCFNEPLVSWIRHSYVGKRMSHEYNISIRKHTLQHAILPFVSGKAGLYPEFDEVIQKHFRLKQMQLEHQMQQWLAEDSHLKSIVGQILPKLDSKRKASANIDRVVVGQEDKESLASKKRKTEPQLTEDSKPKPNTDADLAYLCSYDSTPLPV